MSFCWHPFLLGGGSGQEISGAGVYDERRAESVKLLQDGELLKALQ